jgi:site-specific recombinase XerD
MPRAQVYREVLPSISRVLCKPGRRGLHRLAGHVIDFGRKVLRITQSKGLKDRLVPFTPEAATALANWLSLRDNIVAEHDDAATLGQNHVFVERHLPLSISYCAGRLSTFGRRCAVKCTPHQLRHSCATLLLNGGMPIASVQATLGHKYVSTTLGYARVYDGTAAADYTRAMLSVERTLMLGPARPAPTQAQMIALCDSLKTTGTLNPQ